MTDLHAPRYGEAALCDVLPSVLAALGEPTARNPLDLAPVRRVCVVLVDGLGWTALQKHPDVAPTLAALRGRPLTAGFPSTTATSLSSLGTGLPPGEHGITGYTSYVDEVDAAVNWLAWHPVGRNDDLRDRIVPEAVQPEPTVFERAERAGIVVTRVAPASFERSGLTRAVLRGGRWAGTVATGDVAASAADALRQGDRCLVYAYVGEFDLVGHVYGPGTEQWLAQLALVDAFVGQIVDRMPPDAALVVIADHGMVLVPDEDKLDLDADTDLMDGVIAVAGEPRCRYLHTRRSAAGDVLTRWRERLADGWLVLSRQEAVAAGLFGPTVSAEASQRIGDVVVLATGAGGLVRRSVESRLSSLPGQHGSLTDDELLVPLLEAGS